MGKPSVPTQPTPPTAQELSNATVETASHMAKLQRAMEFGEELLRDVTNEDGSRFKYDKVKTEITEGFKPVHESQTITASGPKQFRIGKSGSYLPLDSDGKTTEDYKGNGFDVPKGTNWHDLDAKFPSSMGEISFDGSQPIEHSIKTLTGYSATGEKDDSYESLNQYFKTSYDKDGNVLKDDDGNVIREQVERAEALDADFKGVGDVDRAMERWEFEKSTSSEVADHLLQQARKYGLGEGLEDGQAGFIKTAVDMLRESDEKGYDLRQQLAEITKARAEGKIAELRDPSWGGRY